ncbi:MAG: hypothetical protein N2258_07090 [Brevinematales bacterium]|nr:hypothetical protein [Brevinematales bacterium]
MKLKINNEIIDFVLENEKNVLDVLKSLSQLLSTEDALITRVLIDGNEINFDDDALSKMPVDNVREIEVVAQKKEEVIYDLFLECQRLLTEVKNSLKERGLSQKQEIIDAFIWVKDTIQTIGKTGYIGNSESITIISSIEKVIKFFELDEKDINIETLITVIDSLINYVKAVREKLIYFQLPKKEELGNLIDESLNLLPKVSEAFQIGKDKEALQSIEYLINVMEILTTFLKRNIKTFKEDKQEKVSKLYEDMNSLLVKVIEAFENMDMVLIGDLFEYELSNQLALYKEVVVMDS